MDNLDDLQEPEFDSIDKTSKGEKYALWLFIAFVVTVSVICLGMSVTSR